MGTRSTIHIYDNYGRHLVSIYNQYDGYYQGVGKEIYEWFKNKENYGNGFSDTMFLFIANWKGNTAYHKYLTTETDEQEYNYYISWYEGQLTFTIKKEVWIDERQEFYMQTTLRNGTLEQFLEELNTEN